jgi:hypothetical protein
MFLDFAFTTPIQTLFKDLADDLPVIEVNKTRRTLRGKRAGS